MDIRNKILSTSEDLFTEHGIKQVSMDNIAEALAISKKTIYQIFPNKKELVLCVIQMYLEQEEKMISEIKSRELNAIDEMIEITRNILSFFKNMSPLLIYDLKKYHPEGWKLIEERHFTFIKSVIRDNIQRGISQGIYRSDLDSEIIAKFYVQLSVIASDEQIFPPKAYPIQALFIQKVTYHLHGIVNESGKRKLINWSKEMENDMMSNKQNQRDNPLLNLI
ncbi:MAG TPA: TetR/AcrR family transcriptional regulator [Saprospiraceae bacterium]|nr:TetR/AcrR family transcriptional regulator [Saprospiraceae bacterium]